MMRTTGTKSVQFQVDNNDQGTVSLCRLCSNVLLGTGDTVHYCLGWDMSRACICNATSLLSV